MTDAQKEILEVHKKFDDGVIDPDKLIDLVCQACKCGAMDVIDAIVASSKEEPLSVSKRVLKRIK